MTTPTAEWGLGGGKHVCLVHDSHDERMRVLERHVACAFRAGERILALPESTDDQRLADVLNRTGDGPREGQVVVRPARDAYLPRGSFDPAATIDVLHAEKRAALADGFTGVRFLAEMDWAAGDAPGTDSLCEYESAANAVFADGRASAVCQYDRTRFRAAEIATCAAAHGSVATAFEPGEVLRDDRVVIDVGHRGTVRARGEVDMDNARLLDRALGLAALHSGEVTVDASGLTFIDMRGLHALLRAARRSSVAVLAPSAPLRTMLDVLDVRRHEPHLLVG